MHFFNFQSLRFKIIFFVLSLLFSGFLGHFFLIKNIMNRHLENQQHEFALTMARDLAEDCYDHMITGDIIKLSIILESHLRTYPFLRYAVVTDSQNKIMAHTFAGGIPDDLAKFINQLQTSPESVITQEVQTAQGPLHHVQYRFVHNLGTLQLGVADTERANDLREMMGSFISMGSIVFIFIAVMALWFSLKLSHDVTQLSSAVKELELGNENVQTHIRRKDEIGQLALAFNSMATKLKLTSISKNQLSDILRSLDEILIVINSENQIEISNPAVQKILGYDMHELKGQNIDLLTGHTSVLTDFIDKEILLFSKEGVGIPFMAGLSPLMDYNGQLRGMIMVASDLRETKKIQQQMENEKALALQSAKLAALGEMAAGIAHEINTPLTIIQLLGDKIKRVCAKTPLEVSKIYESLELLNSTIGRISKIIQGLRSFARNDSDAPYENVPVSKLFEDTLVLCQEKCKKMSVDLQINIPPDTLALYGNAIQLSQVLINLISNAVDAIADTPEAWIKLAATEIGNNIEISVTDSGHGIPPAVAEKIFNPFFTTKEVGKGTGIGLSISKNIMDAHKGKINLDHTSPNTRFKIFLPKNNIVA